MATQVQCPKCGKVGTSAKTLMPGKIVRCPACGESFQYLAQIAPDPSPQASKVVPGDSTYVSHEIPRQASKGESVDAESIQEFSGLESPMVTLDLGIDLNQQKPVIRSKLKSKPKNKPTWVVCVVVGCLAVLFGFGIGLVQGKSSYRPPTPEAQLDRLVNPFRIASISWSESEDEIRQMCFDTSDKMIANKKFVNSETVAYMLASCGREERTWRGKEKCKGVAFATYLFAEMVIEGTTEEDAVRVLVKIHKMRPGGGDGIPPTECLRSRIAVYDNLKMGKFLTRFSAYDQFLRNAHLVPGNDNFDYK